MESKMDVSLFKRSTQMVRLTEAGRFLLLQSDTMLLHVDTTLIRLPDRFALIIPAGRGTPDKGTATSFKSYFEKLGIPWLQISRNSNTARGLGEWLSKRGLSFETDMELDSFDLIANLVSLGIGYSCVPIRSLAPYNRNKKIQRVNLNKIFSREIVVLTSKSAKLENHIKHFIELIPFS